MLEYILKNKKVLEVSFLEESQLLKGVLEGCVLYIISKGETYGYEILGVLEKKGFGEILEGTLYPVLTRLNKRGDITCKKIKSPFGPIRKYYSITEKGHVNLDEFLINYKKITNAAIQILEEVKND